MLNPQGNTIYHIPNKWKSINLTKHTDDEIIEEQNFSSMANCGKIPAEGNLAKLHMHFSFVPDTPLLSQRNVNKNEGEKKIIAQSYNHSTIVIAKDWKIQISINRK